MAEDARCFLDHLGIARADVMGYSMGARISAFLAMHHPERVRSLVFGGLGVNMVRGMAGTADRSRLGGAEHRRRDQSNRSHFSRIRRADRQRFEGFGRVHPLLARSHNRRGTGRIEMPVLVAVGSTDVVGGSAADLAALIPAPKRWNTGRDHMKAVGDRIYKDGVLAFLKRRPDLYSGQAGDLKRRRSR